jgi:hypothetical protein
LIKYVMSCVFVASSIYLTTAEGSAASKRFDMDRCAYVSCFRLPLAKRYGYSRQGGPTDSAKKLRRNRLTEDAVSRLQDKIAREQSKRRKTSERDRNHYSYSETNPYAYSPFRGIDCRKGRLLVQGQGFYRVNPLECQGRIFTYLAREKGKMVRVTVDSRYGKIIGTRPF